MRDIREKFMCLDRSKYDKDLLELLDQIIWRLEEFDNRLRSADRAIVEILTR
ncbi:MAG: hypothetical protein N2316_02590 [Spirochaetes bacterium]|nr:hypothetical protein [Spirochaetota bacterium]